MIFKLLIHLGSISLDSYHPTFPLHCKPTEHATVLGAYERILMTALRLRLIAIGPKNAEERACTL